jgi:oxaloacetate decarboxylase gamma subunit
LLGEGVRILILGMGTVFAFLALLVAVVSGMSRMAAWHERRTGATSAAVKPAAGHDADPDASVLPVIAAAVHHYRATHR